MPTEIVTLLNRAASEAHLETARHLTELRDRLGRDGTSMDEWNALISAISDENINAWRRARQDYREVSWQTPVRLYGVTWDAGMISSKLFSTVKAARKFGREKIARGAVDVMLTPVTIDNLSPDAIATMLDPDGDDEDILVWHHDQKKPIAKSRARPK